MDPKKQAVDFYHSLAAADAVSCALLARNARFQRGRVVALNRRITALQLAKAPKEEITKLELEAERRTKLAANLDALDGVIDQAIKKRAELDKGKFK